MKFPTAMRLEQSYVFIQFVYSQPFQIFLILFISHGDSNHHNHIGYVWIENRMFDSLNNVTINWVVPYRYSFYQYIQ